MASVTDEPVRSIGGMTLTLARGNQRTRREKCPSATASTAQSTQTGPALSSASQQENNTQMCAESRKGESSCALDASRQMNQNFQHSGMFGTGYVAQKSSFSTPSRATASYQPSKCLNTIDIIHDQYKIVKQ